LKIDSVAGNGTKIDMSFVQEVKQQGGATCEHENINMESQAKEGGRYNPEQGLFFPFLIFDFLSF